jgi:hypothetical protein
MMNFILPEGLKIIESRLKVTSNSLIPAFDGIENGCDDDGLINIDSKYKAQATEGDFILFAGVYNNSNNDTLAYASVCVLGILNFI